MLAPVVPLPVTSPMKVIAPLGILTATVLAEVIIPLASTVITGIVVREPYVLAVTPEFGKTAEGIVPVRLLAVV